VNIVTQNIDTLSQQTRQAWNHAEQLVEVHGRMGIYHCSGGEGDGEGGGHCEMATETFMTTEELWGKEIGKAIEDPEVGTALPSRRL
jgi:YD repeat-containing protein